MRGGARPPALLGTRIRAVVKGELDHQGLARELDLSDAELVDTVLADGPINARHVKVNQLLGAADDDAVVGRLKLDRGVTVIEARSKLETGPTFAFEDTNQVRAPRWLVGPTF